MASARVIRRPGRITRATTSTGAYGTGAKKSMLARSATNCGAPSAVSFEVPAVSFEVPAATPVTRSEGP